MKKVPRREGKSGGGHARGTAGFGAGPSPLRLKVPGGEHRIPGAKGYAAGGKSLFSPFAFLVAGLAGGGAVASAFFQRIHLVGPQGGAWILYSGLGLAGLAFLWEGRRRFSQGRRKSRRKGGGDSLRGGGGD